MPIVANWNHGKGRSHQWLVDHIDYPHDYCLIWPFSLTRGYGALSHMGRRGYAHRFMCELAHGAPPTPLHEAAHSCGRGDEGCVNPRHLSWKTKTENQLDCRKHGTQAKSRYGRQGKLSPDQVAEIRTSDARQCDLARKFGVHETTISNIRTGRTRTAEQRFFTVDEIRLIRSTPWQVKTARQMAAEFNVSAATIGRIRQGASYRWIEPESADPRLQADVGQTGSRS